MWRFKTLSVGDPERDPHEPEFFNLTGISEVIVREFIQNTLDAKCEPCSIIRITFETTSKTKAKKYFDSIENHLTATKFYPSELTTDVVPFITIEDFGTTGLDGKTGEDGDFPEGKNNFYNFWWCEGKSGKTGKDRGRWGLGKTTFHVASKIRSFWGLTVRRNDNRKLLMGKALLKTHKINSATYTSNGYFTAEGYKPISEESLLRQFSDTFALSRDDEPGLSLVIPFPHSEITPNEIFKSIMIHYFYPILNGTLEIMLRYDGKEEELNSKNFIELASQQDWEGTSWENVRVKDLLDFVNSSREKSVLMELKISNPENPEITTESFQNQLDSLREKFNCGEIISLRVPVQIKEVNEQIIDSYFEVFIQKKKDNNIPADEYYVRSGITITDIKMISRFPVRSLFIAEDEAIAKFLGDAETPAHTDWKERTEGFTEKYEHARRKLRFIKKGVSSIISYVYLPPKELKKDFLKDIFYVNVEPEIENEDEEDTSGKVKKDIPKPKPGKYHLTKIDGGFRLIKSKNEIEPPLKVRITCAYDTRKGNPFKNYELYDFDLGNSEFNFSSKGCTVAQRKDNKIELTIEEKEFEFEVTGFDKLRDVVIDIKEKGS
jgi:hypothetical protein